jgi:hypothetical protein
MIRLLRWLLRWILNLRRLRLRLLGLGLFWSPSLEPICGGIGGDLERVPIEFKTATPKVLTSYALGDDGFELRLALILVQRLLGTG